MTPESTIAPPEGSILIIDDSPDNLRVLSRTLSTCGYAVRCVTNGEMAFVSIQNRPPDLILLDIRMPGVSGYDICQQLKQDSALRNIPVIFLSALDSVEDIVKAFQAGGADYITKPFQTEEVLVRIQNQLKIQRLSRQISAQNQHLLEEIDERKKTEQALYQEIQRRILMEASLQDAKNAAEAANDARSKFLAQMSHELRTPLNVILGFTTLMIGDGSLSEDQQSYLTTIDESARRLLKLLNNILTLTHAESSQLYLSEQEFDLHQLLDSIVNLWQTKAVEKGLKFEFQRAATVPQHVQSDESKLRQILMNLLDKAIQTTPNGLVAVRVDSEPAASWFSNETVCLVMEVLFQDVERASGQRDDTCQDFPKCRSYQPLVQEPELSLMPTRQFAQLMGGDIVFQSFPEHQKIFKVQILVRLPSSVLIESSASPQDSRHLVQSPSDPVPLALDTLKFVMSNDWLEQLHQAAVKGFDQQIIRLIGDIPATHSALAKTLELWTRNFQFDRITELTQQLTQ